MFSQLGIPLTIVKDEMMMEMKGPKLRRSPKVLQISSSSVLEVAAARVFAAGGAEE